MSAHEVLYAREAGNNENLTYLRKLCKVKTDVSVRYLFWGDRKCDEYVVEKK